MKQHITLLLSFLFVFQLTTAQKHKKEFTLRAGPIYKEKKIYVMYPQGAEGNSYYIFKKFYTYTKNKYYYAKYDIKKLTIDKDYEIENKYNGKLLFADYSFYLNNKFHLISYTLNKRKKKSAYYHQTFDQKDFKTKSIEKIFENNYKWHNIFNEGFSEFSFSRDSTKLMMIKNYYSEKKDKAKINFIIFNNKVEKEWEKIIDLPYNDNLFDIKDFYVDNQGNAYVLGKHYKNKKRKDFYKGNINFNYLIFAVYDKGNRVEKFEVNMPTEKPVYQMKLMTEKNGDILCTGLYTTDSKTIDYIDGSFFVRIDPKSKQIVTQSYKAFDIDFKTKYLKKGKQKRLKKRASKGKAVQMRDYEIRELIAKGDGGLILIAEQEKITDKTYSVGNRSVIENYYEMGHIIVVNIDKNGKILWQQKINKEQYGSKYKLKFFSYFFILRNHNLYFVFNHNLKNSTKGKASVKIVKIDQEGHLTEQDLYDVKKNGKVFIYPDMSKKISNNKYILGSRAYKRNLTKNRYRLFELTFED